MSVHSDAWKQHLQDLKRFLMEIRRSGLTLNLAKSNFAVAQVKFVGHIIGNGYREPDPDKLAAVKNLLPPVDKKQVSHRAIFVLQRVHPRLRKVRLHFD